MEMDRGRADPQRLGELAQAEPVRADALDQLGGGDDDRRFAQAGAGSGLPIRTRALWPRIDRYGIVTARRACGPTGGPITKGMKKISYSGYRFPPEIIQKAIWLYLRFTLSLRDVEDLLAE